MTETPNGNATRLPAKPEVRPDDPAPGKGRPPRPETGELGLSQIIQSMAIPTFVIDRDHVVTHWNRACEKLTGIDAADIIGTRDAWKAFYSEKRPVLAELVVDGSTAETVARFYPGKYAPSELVAGAYEAQDYFPHLGNGGRWLFFTATPLTDISGRIVGAIETFQDFTDRMRTEEVLRESEEKLRQITASAQDAIVMMDDRGNVTFWNASAEKIFGYSEHEIIGRELHTVLAPKHFIEHYYRSFARFRQAGQGPNLNKTIELTAVKKDGTAFPIELSLSAVKIKRRWHAIGVVRDITERKHAERVEKELDKQLQQSQKMAAIGTLAGGIAHDFNNILSAIIGYTELALIDLPPGTSLRHKLEGIRNSGNRARELVAQILSFSRKEEQIRTPVALHLLIQDALKLLRPIIPATIDIRTKITADCHVMGDPSRLHQIILNLCTNAYQAMLETGGTLTIVLTPQALTEPDASLARLPPGDYARLTVSDTGTGIPPRLLDRIFEPYFTTKDKGKGTGLGLAAVHGIVNSHDGTISVESRVGEGTTFFVHLPLTRKPHKGDLPSENQSAGGNERILLVDDEPVILEIQKEMLDRLGYTVTALDKPAEALALFAADPAPFDLVITDMTMPVMTGANLVAEMRKIRSDIPVILCTGFSETMSKEKAAALGVNGFLMKPITFKDLSQSIRALLGA